MDIVRLKLEDLEPNAGQIDGLPVNPRQWTRSDIDLLAKSLKETPELFEARPIIVVPHEGKFVILGGNMRYEASKQNKAEDVPAIIFPENTTTDKLKEIVIKDNGAFGSWDYDALANEWDDLPLTEWGVAAWETEDLEPVTDEDNYSRKIEAPIYEPIGVDVGLDECVDTAKYDELLAEIEKADIPNDVADFLKMAATRHIVFDYSRIAEYYSKAPQTVKELMENSALVIIDFGKAIEKGFVKMTEELRMEYLRQNENK